jgi:hypothetical protein
MLNVKPFLLCVLALMACTTPEPRVRKPVMDTLLIAPPELPYPYEVVPRANTDTFSEMDAVRQFKRELDETKMHTDTLHQLIKDYHTRTLAPTE